MSTILLPSIQTELNRYGYLFLLIFGIIGNCFCIILFNKHYHRSCSMYLSWASIFNNLYLIFALPPTLYSLTYGDLNSRSFIYCKLRFYLTHTLGQVARSFVILACIDRFALTTINIRFRQLTQPSTARILMICTFLFWNIFAIHIPILTTINNGRCSQFGIYYILYYTYIIIFVCIIPIILMSIFGYLTYRNMKQLHLRIQPMRNSLHNQQENVTIQRRDRELLYMVLAEVIIHLLTMLLYPFIMFEMAVTTYIGMNKTVDQTRIENFIMTIASLLLFINVGSRFYIFLAISKPFRKQSKKCFISLWKRELVTNEVMQPT